MKVDKKLIESTIEAATNFEQIRVLLQEDCEWDCEEAAILPSVNKAIELVTTFEQGHCLQVKLATDGDSWDRLIENMIALAKDDDDLSCILYDYFELSILEDRDAIRMVLDRADELDKMT